VQGSGRDVLNPKAGWVWERSCRRCFLSGSFEARDICCWCALNDSRHDQCRLATAHVTLFRTSTQALPYAATNWSTAMHDIYPRHLKNPKNSCSCAENAAAIARHDGKIFPIHRYLRRAYQALEEATFQILPGNTTGRVHAEPPITRQLCAHPFTWHNPRLSAFESRHYSAFGSGFDTNFRWHHAGWCPAATLRHIRQKDTFYSNASVEPASSWTHDAV
jgi:hypothetical protein